MFRFLRRLYWEALVTCYVAAAVIMLDVWPVSSLNKHEYAAVGNAVGNVICTLALVIGILGTMWVVYSGDARRSWLIITGIPAAFFLASFYPVFVA